MADRARYRLTVDIDRESPVPVYQQIADHIRDDITTGRLQPGRRIPSLRELEDDTESVTMTVRKAVGVLVQEGYVRIVPGKGTFVNPPEKWQAGG